MKIYIFFALGMISLFSSCDVVEPDRYINEEAKRQVSGALYSSNYDTNKVFGTSGNIDFRLVNIDFPVSKVLLYRDSSDTPQELTVWNGNTFSMNVYPASENEGTHTFYLDIIAKNRGFLTMNDVPVLRFKLQYTVYTGNSLAVRNIGLSMSAQPKVNWTPSLDPFFVCYKIVRRCGSYLDTIATIQNQFQLSYTDSLYPGFVGKNAVAYSVVAFSRFASKQSVEIKGDYYGALSTSKYTDSGAGAPWMPGTNGTLFLYTSLYGALSQVDLLSGTVLSTVTGTGGFGMKMSSQNNAIVGTVFTSSYCLWVADYTSKLTAWNIYKTTLAQSGSYANAEEISQGKWLFYCNSNTGRYLYSLFDITKRRFTTLNLPASMANKGYYLSSALDGFAYSTNNADSVFRIDARDTNNVVFSPVTVIPNLKSIRSYQSGTFLVVQKNAVSIYTNNFQISSQKIFSEDIDAVSCYGSVCAVTFKGTASTYPRIEVWDMNSWTCQKVILHMFISVIPQVLSDGSVALYVNYSDGSYVYKSFYIVK